MARVGGDGGFKVGTSEWQKSPEEQVRYLALETIGAQFLMARKENFPQSRLDEAVSQLYGWFRIYKGAVERGR